MRLVQLRADLYSTSDQLFELEVMTLERKGDADIGRRIEHLRRTNGRREVCVTSHEYDGIAATPKEQLEHFARYGNVGFLLLVRAIGEPHPTGGNGKALSKRSHLNSHVGQNARPFFALEFREGDFHSGGFESGNECPVPSDDVRVLVFEMGGQRREIVHAVQSVPGTECALHQRLAQVVNVQPFQRPSPKVPLSILDRVVQVEPVNKKANSHGHKKTPGP